MRKLPSVSVWAARSLVLIIGLGVAAATAGSLTGCALGPSATAVKQAQADEDKAYVKAQQAREAAALKLQQVLAAQKLLETEALANPIRHPIEAADLVVVAIKPWMIGLAIAGFILSAVAFGLKLTTLLKIGLRVFGYSAAAAFVLPFCPPLIWLLLGGILGDVVYLLIKDKGNVAEVALAVETQAKAVAGEAAAK
ncbi:MAG: hypothetical protein ABSF29_16230 [Tepidisphaeraceae bacterium]|jgi:hypothetical protein